MQFSKNHVSKILRLFFSVFVYSELIFVREGRSRTLNKEIFYSRFNSVIKKDKSTVNNKYLLESNFTKIEKLFKKRIHV